MTTDQTEHLFVQFQSPEGEAAGAAVSIPSTATPQQLEALINRLLQNVYASRRHDPTARRTASRSPMSSPSARWRL